MEHLYADGKEGAAAIRWAKETAERRKCNHWQTKASADECIAGIIGDDNRYRYVVASQSYDLRAAMRQVPGVPIVYLNPRSVLLLEPPSDATISKRQNMEQSKLHVPAHELDAIASTSSNVVAGPVASTSTASVRSNAPKTVEQVLGKRKRPVKGPNPLSVKKKKQEPAPRKPSAKPAQAADATTAAVEPLRQSALTGVGRDVAAATTAPSRKRRKRGRRAGAGASAGDAAADDAGAASGDD